MLGAFIWLLLFQLAGEVLVRWLNLPLPGAVVGMLLLLTWLVIRGGIAEDLQAAGSTLLRHLMLLLVPATTGVMVHGKRVDWLPIVVAGVGGAAVTMTVTALTLRLLLARGTERGP